jgi:hypothetical protein
MSNVIYKYEIFPNATKNGVFPIKVKAHRGAKPIHVGIQNGRYYVWMEVNTDEREVEMTPLVCVGTGCGVIPEGYKHFQSIICDPFVCHFYIK